MSQAHDWSTNASHIISWHRADHQYFPALGTTGLSSSYEWYNLFYEFWYVADGYQASTSPADALHMSYADRSNILGCNCLLTCSLWYVTCGLTWRFVWGWNKYEGEVGRHTSSLSRTLHIHCSLEPGETPSYSASHQVPNYVQRS